MSKAKAVPSRKPTGLLRGLALGSSIFAFWSWCVKTIWPWFLEQISNLWTNASVGLPRTGEEFIALAGFFVLPVFGFLAYFIIKVWIEIEKGGVYERAAIGVSSLASYAVEKIYICYMVIFDSVLSEILWFNFSRKYRKEVVRLRNLLDVRNLVMATANHLELDDIYISLRVARQKPGRDFNENPIHNIQSNDRVSVWEHFKNSNCQGVFVVVGAPGSGKTTLLKYLMLAYARGAAWIYRVKSRIPIFIELRKLPKYIGKGTQRLDVVLEKMLRDEVDLKELINKMPETWLTQILDTGRAIILCDGLDEIVDLKIRKKISDWIQGSSTHTDWHRNLFVVTARPAGYKTANIAHAKILEVQPFEWEDTKNFIQKWNEANRVISMKPGTSKKTIKDLATNDANILIKKLQDHSRLGVLTSNPLLLTMVCLMHEKGHLPGSRSQLYKEICEVHLDRWRRRVQGPERRDTWTAEQKLTVLRPLANFLMKKEDVVGNSGNRDSKRISTNELLEVCKNQLSQIGLENNEDIRLAFFQSLHDESAILLQWEPGEWGFAHLSFQEYLCADYWFSNNTEAPQAEDWRKLIDLSWWRETVLLYACKATNLRPLIQGALDSGTENGLSFLFALESETVSIPSDQVHQIDYALNIALESRERRSFESAGKAWLIRQNDNNYLKIGNGRWISGWVTNAEYQCFLNEMSERSFIYHPLHEVKWWLSGGSKDPVLGVGFNSAQKYCRWLESKFPEFKYSFVGSEDEPLCYEQNSRYITWMENGALSCPSALLKDNSGSFNCSHGVMSWFDKGFLEKVIISNIRFNRGWRFVGKNMHFYRLEMLERSWFAFLAVTVVVVLLVIGAGIAGAIKSGGDVILEFKWIILLAVMLSGCATVLRIKVRRDKIRSEIARSASPFIIEKVMLKCLRNLARNEGRVVTIKWGKNGGQGSFIPYLRDVEIFDLISLSGVAFFKDKDEVVGNKHVAFSIASSIMMVVWVPEIQFDGLYKVFSRGSGKLSVDEFCNGCEVVNDLMKKSEDATEKNRIKIFLDCLRFFDPRIAINNQRRLARVLISSILNIDITSCNGHIFEPVNKILQIINAVDKREDGKLGAWEGIRLIKSNRD